MDTILKYLILWVEGFSHAPRDSNIPLIQELIPLNHSRDPYYKLRFFSLTKEYTLNHIRDP